MTRPAEVEAGPHWPGRCDRVEPAAEVEAGPHWPGRCDLVEPAAEVKAGPHWPGRCDLVEPVDDARCQSRHFRNSYTDQTYSLKKFD